MPSDSVGSKGMSLWRSHVEPEDPCEPLLLAACRGVVEFVCIADPRSAMVVPAINRPTIVMVCAWPSGGDVDLCPCAWRCLPTLREWSSAALVYGHPGTVDVFRAAVITALRVGHLALVGASWARAADWAAHLAHQAAPK
jgi:hypothetical protein